MTASALSPKAPVVPASWPSNQLVSLTYDLQPGVRPRGATGAGVLQISAKPFAPGDDGKLYARIGTSFDDALAAARDISRKATSVPTAVFGTTAVMQSQDGSYWITVLTASHGGQVASPMLDGPRFGDFVKKLTVTSHHADLRAVVGGNGYVPLGSNGAAGDYRLFASN